MPTENAGQSPEALMDAGQFADARALLLREHSRNAGDYRVNLLLGIANYKLRDFVAAEGYYRRACQARPKSHVACYNLGLCHEALGEIEAARTLYTKAISLDPSYQAAKSRLVVIGTPHRAVTTAVQLKPAVSPKPQQKQSAAPAQNELPWLGVARTPARGRFVTLGPFSAMRLHGCAGVIALLVVIAIMIAMIIYGYNLFKNWRSNDPGKPPNIITR